MRTPYNVTYWYFAICPKTESWHKLVNRSHQAAFEHGPCPARFHSMRAQPIYFGKAHKTSIRITRKSFDFRPFKWPKGWYYEHESLLISLLAGINFWPYTIASKSEVMSNTSRPRASVYQIIWLVMPTPGFRHLVSIAWNMRQITIIHTTNKIMKGELFAWAADL